jgi:hypothetical protein
MIKSSTLLARECNGLEPKAMKTRRRLRRIAKATAASRTRVVDVASLRGQRASRDIMWIDAHDIEHSAAGD